MLSHISWQKPCCCTTSDLCTSQGSSFPVIRSPRGDPAAEAQCKTQGRISPVIALQERLMVLSESLSNSRSLNSSESDISEVPLPYLLKFLGFPADDRFLMTCFCFSHSLFGYFAKPWRICAIAMTHSTIELPYFIP